MWEYLSDYRLRRAVDVAERYANGECTEEELAAARNAPHEIIENFVSYRDRSYAVCDTDRCDLLMVDAALNPNVREGLERTLQWAYLTTLTRTSIAGVTKRFRFQATDLFREIVGNPFRPWKVAPDFLGGGLVQPDGRVVPLTDTVRALAMAVYADRAFDRLPVLADAAEEAGVTDRSMLDHLRHCTGHVRGCWALDLLLGKG
jgi:hypothetical protein